MIQNHDISSILCPISVAVLFFRPCVVAEGAKAASMRIQDLKWETWGWKEVELLQPPGGGNQLAIGRRSSKGLVGT